MVLVFIEVRSVQIIMRFSTNEHAASLERAILGIERVQQFSAMYGENVILRISTFVC